jgi:hypothetical protein
MFGDRRHGWGDIGDLTARGARLRGRGKPGTATGTAPRQVIDRLIRVINQRQRKSLRPSLFPLLSVTLAPQRVYLVVLLVSSSGVGSDREECL